MLEVYMPGQANRTTPEPNVKEGLVERKALNANNDRPLMQIDRANQWSDYSVIPGAKEPADQTVLVE